MLAGDDLSTCFFFLSMAVAVGGMAMTAAGWRHPALIRGLFVLAAIFFVAGIGWPLGLKTISPAATAAIRDISTNPVSWFVLFMFVVGSSVIFSPLGRGVRGRTVEKTIAEHVIRLERQDAALYREIEAARSFILPLQEDIAELGRRLEAVRLWVAPTEQGSGGAAAEPNNILAEHNRRLTSVENSEARLSQSADTAR
jgi:hypothetical protein